jgi:cytochrome c oxidase subunit 2
VRRRALVLVLASAAALTVTGLASAGSGGLLPASPESDAAEQISDVYLVVLVVAAVAFLAVQAALVWLLVRGRRRGRPRTEEGAQAESGGHTQLVWTLVPILVLSGLASFALYKLPEISNAPEAGAAGDTRITVEAHQFYWLFRYPNGAVSVNQLTAPADTVVHLEVTAPENDVNHSWWVPRLGPKIDAIPGRTNETWFRANEGTYVARCAELCGIQHTAMTGSVRVVSRVAYANFLGHEGDEIELGRQHFQGVCLTCHRLDEPFVGPALAGSAALADRERLETLVREGIRTMPAVGSTWSEEQFDALFAYTKGLEASGDES